AVGAGEYGRQPGGVATRHRTGLLGDFEREQHAVWRAPALVGSEQSRGGTRAAAGRFSLAAQHGAAGFPARQLRRPDADALDDDPQPRTVRHAASARAKARQQLLPPKPNELLSAMRGARAWFASVICGPQAASSVALFSVPGTKPSRSAINVITASTM